MALLGQQLKYVFTIAEVYPVKTILTTLAAGAIMTATSVSAATFDGLSGMIAEGPENLILDADDTFVAGTGYDDVTPGHVLGDFSNPVGDPSLSFSGAAWMFGFVGNGYSDGFTIEALDYSYTLQISVIDGPLSMGIAVDGTNYGSYTDGSGMVQIDNLTGETTVSLASIGGSSGLWLVDIVNYNEISAVPLPASSLLLLAGLGGLGAMSRRKKA